LTEFILNIKETQSPSDSKLFLKNIERILINLHGRNEFADSIGHMFYRTKDKWMVGENMNSWTKILDSTLPVYSHLFGFNPVMELTFKSDMELNHALCIPFGIIPEQVEVAIKIMGQDIRRHYADKTLCQTIIQGYVKRWEIIKDILRSRVMGLHSIIGGVSSRIGKGFKNQGKDSRIKERRNQIPKMGEVTFVRPTLYKLSHF